MNDNFANMTTYEQKQMTPTSPFDYGFPKLELETQKTLTDYLVSSPEREHFEDLRYFETEISENFAGQFIGKNGNRIKSLRKKYKSKILISNENGKRYIYVSHSPDTFKIIGEIIHANFLQKV